MPHRTFVVGDIHGCLTEFDALLTAVVPAPDDHVVLLGDYVDRGPDSAGVINRIFKLSKTHRLTCIKGNHEQMMLEAPESRSKLTDWITSGGEATLRSYAGIRATLRDIPGEHWNFLKNQLANYAEDDSHIFVHASAYPDMPLAEQPDYMLRWERFEKIWPHESGKVIVCGHTPQKSGKPANRGYAICIDTYVFGGGSLTCLETSSGRIWQADGRGRVARAHISDFSE